jgi:RimJ/RimL family protein N-acetyltransferase
MTRRAKAEPRFEILRGAWRGPIIGAMKDARAQEPAGLSEILTPRLRLYPPRLEDLEARLAIDRDPEVMRFIRPIPDDAAAQRAEIRNRILEPRPAAFWHAEERAAPGFIGWCGLFPLEDSGLIEIGYRFARAAWDRGLATEAATAALDHGFRELELDPIVAVSDPDNAASHNVLRKIGLRAAGTARHYGRELPFFELRRGEYLARP